MQTTCPLGITSGCFKGCGNRCTEEGFQAFMKGVNYDRAVAAGKKTTKGKRRRGIKNGASAYMASYEGDKCES